MATAIQVEHIGTNRYAPEGANDINLYAFGDTYGLTLGQLVMAVCIRQASVIEEQSVLKMNQLNASATFLDALAQAAEYVMTHSSLDSTFDLSKTGYVPKYVSTRTTYWEFIVYECGVNADNVPHSVTKMDDKTRVFGYLDDFMDEAASDNEDQSIDLQSYLSRRDTAYNTSSSVVKKLGKTMDSVAKNF